MLRTEQVRKHLRKIRQLDAGTDVRTIDFHYLAISPAPIDHPDIALHCSDDHRTLPNPHVDVLELVGQMLIDR
jgi:hypothetical protein